MAGLLYLSGGKARGYKLTLQMASASQPGCSVASGDGRVKCFSCACDLVALPDTVS